MEIQYSSALLKKLRINMGLDMSTAAALIHRSRFIWWRYEHDRMEMPVELFELFLLKTGLAYVKDGDLVLTDAGLVGE